MESNFTELRAVTLADSVETLLLNYIHKEGLVPGELLPKESEIAERLNISRNIVREGVSRLKALNIVESRKRKGMVLVRPDAFVSLKKIADARLFTEADHREMMELRMALEIGMAQFIFLRKTPEAVARLRKLTGPDAYRHDIGTEVNFHSCLFSIGENSMASNFRNVLLGAFAQLEPDCFHHRENPEETKLISTHRQICDALEHGTADEFQAVMKKHFALYLAKSKRIQNRGDKI
ncbi:MAG: Pyruvate dehydrogenase complex repressor [Lentisphaerae bacterium ADurb.Bin242]|nr:MAG: Pyruvate dehydrogenase complex repressor [Lentisphaerae bacterium ADurb.Bin242]